MFGRWRLSLTSVSVVVDHAQRLMPHQRDDNHRDKIRRSGDPRRWAIVELFCFFFFCFQMGVLGFLILCRGERVVQQKQIGVKYYTYPIIQKEIYVYKLYLMAFAIYFPGSVLEPALGRMFGCAASIFAYEAVICGLDAAPPVQALLQKSSDDAHASCSTPSNGLSLRPFVSPWVALAMRIGACNRSGVYCADNPSGLSSLSGDLAGTGAGGYEGAGFRVRFGTGKRRICHCDNEALDAAQNGSRRCPMRT